MLFQHILVTTKQTSIKIPQFLGSTYRGAFGVSLKNVVCINPKKICENCFAATNCLYYDLYEDKNKTPKFRLDLQMNQKNLDFGIYAYEEKCKELPYFISAILQMAETTGIGVNREKFEIDKIHINETLVYENGEFVDKIPSQKTFEADTFCQKVKVEFLTPLRMKQENKMSFYEIGFDALLKSIDNRVADIMGFTKRKLDFEPTFNVIDKKFEFCDLARYSNRQQTKMQLGGLLGYMIVDELDGRSYELLKFGEITGVGKSTVFGLGKIRVEKLA